MKLNHRPPHITPPETVSTPIHWSAIATGLLNSQVSYMSPPHIHSPLTWCKETQRPRRFGKSRRRKKRWSCSKTRWPAGRAGTPSQSETRTSRGGFEFRRRHRKGSSPDLRHFGSGLLTKSPHHSGCEVHAYADESPLWWASGRHVVQEKRPNNLKGSGKFFLKLTVRYACTPCKLPCVHGHCMPTLILQ